MPATPKCPGQDSRNWRPEDIAEAPCPVCGEEIEFFKIDRALPCPNCGTFVLNPQLDPDCREWCAYAEACAQPTGPKKT